MRKIILLAFLITILANAQDTTTSFATLIIETEPKEAIVIINGKVYGLTPANFKLPFGSYQIKLVKEGYYETSFEIDIQRSEVIVKKFKLEETPETKAVREYRKKLLWKGNLTYLGSTLTIASIGIAVALHIKSESIYEKYRASVEIEKIRNYREEYYKVIRQRNIAIGASALFAGLTLYNTLRNVDEIKILPMNLSKCYGVRLEINLQSFYEN
jgi:hypothetical protein